MTSQRIDQILDMTHPPTRHLDLVKVTLFIDLLTGRAQIILSWTSCGVQLEARVNAQATVN